MRNLLSVSIVSIAALSIPGIVKAQNLFVTDSQSGNLFQYTPGGVQSTFASGLSAPNGLAFDNSGDLFATAQFANEIVKFAPGGAQSTFATGLDTPTGLTFYSGNLFEADFSSGNIYKFAPNGTRTTYASGLNDPESMAFDSSGNLFVGAQGSGSIVKITPGGVQSTFASGLTPAGLIFDAAGNLIESDRSTIINEFTPGGAKSTFASGLADNTQQGMAYDSAGNLYVDTWSNTDGTAGGSIYKIAPNGSISTFATGLDFPGFIAFQPVPEPSVWAMFGLGGLALFRLRRKA